MEARVAGSRGQGWLDPAEVVHLSLALGHHITPVSLGQPGARLPQLIRGQVDDVFRVVDHPGLCKATPELQ